MDKAAAVNQYIMEEVADSHEWVLPFVKIHLPSFLSLHGVMLLLCAFFLFVLFGVLYRKTAEVPHGLTNALEALILFIRNQISIPSLGEQDGRRMAPLFCSFFFFILGLNLMGLVPIFRAASGNVNVTAALALITLAFMIFGSIYRNGFVGFLKCFVPHGVPIVVLFLLVPIEFISMFIKAFALTIRLFANMLAGHIVIFALLSLVVLFGWLALPAVLLATGVALLEIFIAFLQAYIFTLLSAMFIGQMVHPEH